LLSLASQAGLFLHEQVSGVYLAIMLMATEVTPVLVSTVLVELHGIICPLEHSTQLERRDQLTDLLLWLWQPGTAAQTSDVPHGMANFFF
jgi:hypothetical protein